MLSGDFPSGLWVAAETQDPETVLRCFARVRGTLSTVLVISQITERKSWWVVRHQDDPTQAEILPNDQMDVYLPSDEQGHGGMRSVNTQKTFRPVFKYTVGDTILIPPRVVRNICFAPPPRRSALPGRHATPLSLSPASPPPPPHHLTALSTRIATANPRPLPFPSGIQTLPGYDCFARRFSVELTWPT